MLCFRREQRADPGQRLQRVFFPRRTPEPPAKDVGHAELALLEFLRRQLVPREELVEIGAVAARQPRRLAHVSRRVICRICDR